MKYDPLSSRQRTSVLGRVLASGFFAIFLAVGGFIALLTAQSVRPIVETHGWTRAEGEIVASAARPRPQDSGAGKPYEWTVEYRYETNGQTFTGTRWSTKEVGFDSIDDALRMAAAYRVGTRQPCWFDPADPREAVLERQSLFNLLIVLFPLIFVAIGVGGIWAVWRRAPAAKPVSERARTKPLSAGCLRLFFLPFLLAGLVIVWSMTIEPLLRINAARAWVPTPARVLSSRVVASSDSDGSSYRVDILYTYTCDGVERRSSQYDFSSSSSKGYATKGEIVSRYPLGAEVTCYVNPRRPSEAVLRREPFKALWFGALGLVFLVVGGLGFFAAARLAKVTLAPASGLPAEARAAHVADSGPVVLRPAQTRLAKFVFLLLFAVVWNGFIGFFFYLEATRPSGGGSFVKAFLGLFGIVGLLLAWGVIHQLLALFNPRVRLTANRLTIPLGEKLQLAWAVEGRASKLRQLRIVLEGREQASYRRGTNSYTDHHVFARLPLLDAAERAQIETGATTFTAPADSMHSFDAPNNKVQWRLLVTGEIPRWPDLADEYAVTILPQPVKSQI